MTRWQTAAYQNTVDEHFHSVEEILNALTVALRDGTARLDPTVRTRMQDAKQLAALLVDALIDVEDVTS
jgi:transcriptional/translational regulatory protein YebC/TACO1